MGSKQTLPMGMEVVMEMEMEMEGRLFEMHALLELGWEEDKSIDIYNQMVCFGF